MLRINYVFQLTPKIRKIEPRLQDGVEYLKIKRLDAFDAGAHAVSHRADLKNRLFKVKSLPTDSFIEE